MTRLGAWRALMLFMVVPGGVTFCCRQQAPKVRIPAQQMLQPGFVRVAGNCVPKALDSVLSVSCCIQNLPNDSELGELTITDFARQEPVYQIKEEFCSDYSADYVFVEGFNRRWVAVSHESFECVEVVVIDVEYQRLSLHTGCWNAQYWQVKELPDAANCEIRLTELEGGSAITYHLCGDTIDLSERNRRMKGVSP